MRKMIDVIAALLLGHCDFGMMAPCSHHTQHAGVWSFVVWQSTEHIFCCKCLGSASKKEDVRKRLKTSERWFILVYWFGFLLLWTFGNHWIEFKILDIYFHKLSRQSPPLQVVNGEWMTSSTVTKSPKSESGTKKSESGVLLPTFKTSRDKDDFENISGSSRFCPPLLLHRPQVPPYWG